MLETTGKVQGSSSWELSTIISDGARQNVGKHVT